MGEEVGALEGPELSKSIGGSCFESIDGSRGALADMGLELGEPKLKHGEQAHGTCANNDHVGRGFARLHRSPA